MLFSCVLINPFVVRRLSAIVGFLYKPQILFLDQYDFEVLKLLGSCRAISIYLVLLMGLKDLDDINN